MRVNLDIFLKEPGSSKPTTGDGEALTVGGVLGQILRYHPASPTKVHRVFPVLFSAADIGLLVEAVKACDPPAIARAKGSAYGIQSFMQALLLWVLDPLDVKDPDAVSAYQAAYPEVGAAQAIADAAKAMQ